MFFFLDFISFLFFFFGGEGGGLVERKQRLKVILILKNHGYKQYTNLLLTVVIEDVNFRLCTCFVFWILEIHQGPLYHHSGWLLQGDQLSEGHHVHPGASHAPPQGGGRNPASRGNPGHGDQPTGGGVRVCHQGNQCNVHVKTQSCAVKATFIPCSFTMRLTRL